MPVSSFIVGEAAEEREPAIGDDTWLSTRDAAWLLGVTTRTLYRFIDDDDLPAYRFGRVLRVKRGDIERYVQEHRIEPGSLAHLYSDDATG